MKFVRGSGGLGSEDIHKIFLFEIGNIIGGQCIKLYDDWSLDFGMKNWCGIGINFYFAFGVNRCICRFSAGGVRSGGKVLIYFM